MIAPEPVPAERQIIWAQMRVPVLSFVALICLLGCIVTLGTLPSGRVTSVLEAGLDLCMVVVVLLFSMEVRHQPPLMRIAAGLGFCWLAILCGIIMLDYCTR